MARKGFRPGHLQGGGDISARPYKVWSGQGREVAIRDGNSVEGTGTSGRESQVLMVQVCWA